MDVRRIKFFTSRYRVVFVTYDNYGHRDQIPAPKKMRQERKHRPPTFELGRRTARRIRGNARQNAIHSGARKFIPEQSENLHLSRSAAN